MKENPMKESEERALEELKSADDYFEAIGNILEFAGEMEGSERCIKYLDKINVLLCKSLLKKYKYLVGTSKKWTKKQSLFSRIKEHIADRREQKKEDTESLLEQVKELHEALKKDFSSSALAPTVQTKKIEVLEGEDNKNNLLEF